MAADRLPDPAFICSVCGEPPFWSLAREGDPCTEPCTGRLVRSFPAAVSPAEPPEGRYTLTFIFKADGDADALSQEDEAAEAFHSLIDQQLETLDGRKL